MELGRGIWAGDEAVDVPAIQDGSSWDVPAQLEVLPDGRESIVFGDIRRLSEGHHVQGENLRHFSGTCGICSCEGVLRRFGVDVTEDDLVEHAVARGECYVSADLSECGGTTPADRVRILSDFGVPAHLEWADSVEELAQHIEHDRGVIIGVNAGVLWDDQIYYGDGGPNHAVTASGVARNPETGELQGIFVNDSGTGVAGRFVDLADLTWSWLDAGGSYVVTEVSPADLNRKDTGDV